MLMSQSSFKDRALRELDVLHPSKMRLITMLPPLSERLNPFVGDGVIIRPALMYSAQGGFNKLAPAWGMIRRGIENDTITERATLVAASSGQTARGLAHICKRLGLGFIAVMKSDVPSQKVNAVSFYGVPVEVLQTPFNTIERAIKEAKMENCVVIDQYNDPANAGSQCEFMAPQLWLDPECHNDVIVIAGGTLATAIGTEQHAKKHGYSSSVILAICADGEEIPAGRTEQSIRREVKNGSLDDFSEVYKVSRYAAFVAAAALSHELNWTMPGPTSGMAFVGSLKLISKHRQEGTLDRMRGPDGTIHITFLCPDGMEWYFEIAKAELHGERDFEAKRILGERLLLLP